GRSFGYMSHDDLQEGRRSMPDKVKKFIHRTVHLGNVGTAPPDTSNDIDIQDALEEDYEPPAPAILIDSQLIPGDVPEPNLGDSF
ncbi:hypothetical protein FRC07_008703, partial [Ceratobasidium sp. 392]